MLFIKWNKQLKEKKTGHELPVDIYEQNPIISIECVDFVEWGNVECKQYLCKKEKKKLLNAGANINSIKFYVIILTPNKISLLKLKRSLD